MAKTNNEISIELQTKFEFYILGLTFTVLALSIQTAKFGTNTAGDVLELLGWLSLFVSGITGLLRGEWVPVLYRISGKIEATERRIAEIENALEHGVDVPVTFIENGAEQQVTGPQAIQRFRAVIAELERHQADHEAKIIRRYTLMKAALFIGLACLISARGYEPLRSVIFADLRALFL